MINETKYDVIDTIEEANKYLMEIFINRFSNKFSLDYIKFDSVMESVPTEKINYPLAIILPRVVESDNTIKKKDDNGILYQMFKMLNNKGS